MQDKVLDKIHKIGIFTDRIGHNEYQNNELVKKVVGVMVYFCMTNS